MHECLPVVSVVCCQVEVSAMSWSLVQRSPTDYGASLCVIYKPCEWGGPGPLGAAAPKEKMYLQMKRVRELIRTCCYLHPVRFLMHLIPKQTCQNSVTRSNYKPGKTDSEEIAGSGWRFIFVQVGWNYVVWYTAKVFWDFWFMFFPPN